MLHSAMPKPRYARSLRLLPILALSSLLSACSPDNVVVKPISLAPIKPGLMASMKTPACDLPERPAYTGFELARRGDCWAAAYGAVAGRYHGLQRAVRAREKALSQIVKK